MQRFASGFDAAWFPAPIALDPRLTDDDVAWLNEQLRLVDVPTVRFARKVAVPPPPGGRRSSSDAL